MNAQTKKIVEDLERERDALLRKFIEVTDLAERYNEQAYEISCRIESINLALREAEDSGLVDPERNRHSDGRHICHVPRTLPDDEGEGGKDGESDGPESGA